MHGTVWSLLPFGVVLAVALITRQVLLGLLMGLLTGAFVGLVRVTGGIASFARWMESRARSVRSGFLWTWLSCAFTFMAPDFRIMTVAPMMEDVFERLQVPTERVSLLIEATATPLTAVIPIGTVFIGYITSLVATESMHHGLAAAGHVSLPLIVGAVFAGGTFGGFASPFSDNTVAMAAVMKLPVLAYARAKLRFGLAAAFVRLLLYAGAGWLVHGA